MVEGRETNQAPVTRGDGGASPVDESAEQARRIGRSARERVFGVVDERKNSLVGKVDDYVDKIRGNETLHEIPLLEEGVEQVRQFADSIRDKNAEDLLDDFRDAAHRRPGAFMLGSLAAGFLVGRFLCDIGAKGEVRG